MHSCEYTHVSSPDPYAAGSELLKALASPIRLAIVDELSHGPRCVHELVTALGLAQPLVSQHLRNLRSARVIKGTRRGREIAYELVDDHVTRIAHDAIAHATEIPQLGQPDPVHPPAHLRPVDANSSPHPAPKDPTQ